MSFPQPYGSVPPPMYNSLITTMYQNMHQRNPVMVPHVAPKNSVITKLFFINEGDNRRLLIKKNTKMKGILLHIERYLSPYVKKLGVRIDKMQYEDDEGDWMNFSSDTEWIECLKITLLKKKSRKLRIRIYTSSEVEKDVVEPTMVLTKPIPDVSEPSVRREVVIHNCPCSNCKSPRIVGTRYKCTTKPDVDLCQNCFKSRSEELRRHSFQQLIVPNIVARTISGITVPPPFVVPKEYKDKVRLLVEMGFKNESLSVELLKKHNGDLQSVVKEQLVFKGY